MKSMSLGFFFHPLCRNYQHFTKILNCEPASPTRTWGQGKPTITATNIGELRRPWRTETTSAMTSTARELMLDECGTL